MYLLAFSDMHHFYNPSVPSSDACSPLQRTFSENVPMMEKNKEVCAESIQDAVLIVQGTANTI
jgi:hypothetical protein